MLNYMGIIDSEEDYSFYVVGCPHLTDDGYGCGYAFENPDGESYDEPLVIVAICERTPHIEVDADPEYRNIMCSCM